MRVSTYGASTKRTRPSLFGWYEKKSLIWSHSLQVAYHFEKGQGRKNQKGITRGWLTRNLTNSKSAFFPEKPRKSKMPKICSVGGSWFTSHSHELQHYFSGRKRPVRSFLCSDYQHRHRFIQNHGAKHLPRLKVPVLRTSSPKEHRHQDSGWMGLLGNPRFRTFVKWSRGLTMITGLCSLSRFACSAAFPMLRSVSSRPWDTCDLASSSRHCSISRSFSVASWTSYFRSRRNHCRTASSGTETPLFDRRASTRATSACRERNRAHRTGRACHGRHWTFCITWPPPPHLPLRFRVCEFLRPRSDRAAEVRCAVASCSNAPGAPSSGQGKRCAQS